MFLKLYLCEFKLSVNQVSTKSDRQSESNAEGELLAFLKTSPLQMASDQRELEQVENYMEKLQETVNNNNWDEPWNM